MASQQITVTAQIKVKPGMEERLKQEISAVVALTQAEEGCINYDLNQSVDNPSLFMLYENWVSMEALTKHLAMPYIKALGAKENEVVAEPIEVMIWQPVN